MPGRAEKRVESEFVGELTEIDLFALSENRNETPEPLIKRISDRHHALARCLASGMKTSEIMAITGFVPSRISILKNDPAMRNLIRLYREKVNIQFEDMHAKLAGMSEQALAILRDRMDDDPDKIPTFLLNDLIKTGADRTGYGPASHQSMNVHVDIASRLEAARKRLKIVESTATETKD